MAVRPVGAELLTFLLVVAWTITGNYVLSSVFAFSCGQYKNNRYMNFQSHLLCYSGLLLYQRLVSEDTLSHNWLKLWTSAMTEVLSYCKFFLCGMEMIHVCS